MNCKIMGKEDEISRKIWKEKNQKLWTFVIEFTCGCGEPVEKTKAE